LMTFPRGLSKIVMTVLPLVILGAFILARK